MPDQVMDVLQSPVSRTAAADEDRTEGAEDATDRGVEQCRISLEQARECMAKLGLRPPKGGLQAHIKFLARTFNIRGKDTGSSAESNGDCGSPGDADAAVELD